MNRNITPTQPQGGQPCGLSATHGSALSEMIERKKNNPHRKLAEKIARYLFTDGQGERADRLQMMHKTHPSPSERAGAGWCEAAVADRIAEMLLDNTQGQP